MPPRPFGRDPGNGFSVSLLTPLPAGRASAVGAHSSSFNLPPMDAEQHETHQQLPPRRRSRLVLAVLAFALAAAMLVVGAHSRDLHVQRFASVAARRLEPSALRGAIERQLQGIKMPDKYARTEKKSAEDSNSKRASRQRSGGGK